MRSVLRFLLKLEIWSSFIIRTAPGAVIRLGGIAEEWREDPFADPCCNVFETGVYQLEGNVRKGSIVCLSVRLQLLY